MNRQQCQGSVLRVAGGARHSEDPGHPESHPSAASGSLPTLRCLLQAGPDARNTPTAAHASRSHGMPAAWPEVSRRPSDACSAGPRTDTRIGSRVDHEFAILATADRSDRSTESPEHEDIWYGRRPRMALADETHDCSHRACALRVWIAPGNRE